MPATIKPSPGQRLTSSVASCLALAWMALFLSACAETDYAHPDKRTDAELVRCWYSDDNFQRQARVIDLAEKRGVSPINIALAYVLNQPFTTFALIGPRMLSETRTSLPALQVDLTPGELKWLNLEAQRA